MKTRFLSLLALVATLSFASCGDNTNGKAVTDIEKSAADGGVDANNSATVIDNDAGPTVTADADSAMGMDSTAGARP